MRFLYTLDPKNMLRSFGLQLLIVMMPLEKNSCSTSRIIYKKLVISFLSFRKCCVISLLIKWALTEAAHSVGASKNYLGAMYRRTLARKGRKRAAIVVAHAMLRIAYYLLTRKEMYVDLGEDYFDKQKLGAIVRNSVRRLETLGYTVTISEVS